MSRPRAMVAEDETPQRRRLCELLGELWPELEIVAECADGLAALEALTSQHPDVAFLDVRMPGLTGLEVARAADATHVVFTTAFESHALDAFEHAAVDYLLKPIRRERLAQSVVRLKHRLAEAPVDLKKSFGINAGMRWITGSAGNVTRVLGINEVLFFAAQDKYVRVVTASDEVQIRTPLRDLLQALDPEAFWQIHRSVIVRAGAIHRIETGDDGRMKLSVKGHTEELPVSQAFQFRFKPM
ncbi:MAG TPA: LytTR family DNA-binding domain-containing protein [Steroidobacteraceae bacterium]|jgi:DNA-binding LytR/AlgR family response regulator|nr:LytTR family DNA-binding domain-containing protein [Steroidobacteraceae bacterium]